MCHLNSMWWGEDLNKLLRTTDNLNAESKCDSSYTIGKYSPYRLKSNVKKVLRKKINCSPTLSQGRKPKTRNQKQ